MFKRQYLPIIVTVCLFVMMFGMGSFRYTGFLSTQVFLNLFIDNAFLLIVAVGMTFVIISGGIDLSVGSVIALTTMVSATLLQNGWSPGIVIPLVLLMGIVFGWVMGAIIHYFQIQPFIVTLAGMFLARGLCSVINTYTITIDNAFYVRMAQTKVHLPGNNVVSISVVIAILVVLIGIYLAHYTRFGRNTYALGGSEQSALLMGLPVARTKIMVYMFSGLCSALAGVVFTFYMLSGYGLHALGMELDAIAAVVIGGTLLTGGVGFVAGTVFGVLIQGVIQTIISFEGTLSTWWTKIVIGLLLFLFIVLQRLLSSRRSVGSKQLLTK
jgi:ribose/xylose/arabinose/galactoside ABC-type transport system permease subunit